MWSDIALVSYQLLFGILHVFLTYFPFSQCHLNSPTCSLPLTLTKIITEKIPLLKKTHVIPIPAANKINPNQFLCAVLCQCYSS